MGDDVENLMKQCQIGVGGRHALDDAHDIMAECYGTLGKQQRDIAALRQRVETAERRMAKAQAETECFRAFIKKLWGACSVIYWHESNFEAYPIEHNPRAGKDGRHAIEAALREDKP